MSLPVQFLNVFESSNQYSIFTSSGVHREGEFMDFAIEKKIRYMNYLLKHIQENSKIHSRLAKIRNEMQGGRV